MTPTTSNGNGLEHYLSCKSIAKALDIPMRTLRRMMAAGRFPKPDSQCGRQYRWKISTIETYMRESKP